MISRFHNGVPTKQEQAAFNRELAKLKPLTASPVRLAVIEDTSQFGEPVDLGIFPKPSILIQAKQA